MDAKEAGALIYTARRGLHMSRAALGEAAQVSESWIRRIEAGTQVVNGKEYAVRPTPQTVIKIAKALGLSPTDLLEAYGLKLRTDTGDRAHLLALAESLSEKNLQRAIGALEVLMG